MRGKRGLAALVVLVGVGAVRPAAADSAYELRPEVDVPVLAIASVFGLGRASRGGFAVPAYCAPECDPSKLNGLDKEVAGRYHPSWGTWSNVGLFGLQGLVAAGVLADEGPRSGWTDLVVIAESAVVAHAASGLSAAAFGR